MPEPTTRVLRQRRKRLGDLLRRLQEVLSVQDWQPCVEYRRGLVVSDMPAIAAVIVFPELLQATIMIDENQPFGRQARGMVHETVHLTQHEVISTVQKIDRFCLAPQSDLLRLRLMEAIEPNCVRITRALCESLLDEFPELDEDYDESEHDSDPMVPDMAQQRGVFVLTGAGGMLVV